MEPSLQPLRSRDSVRLLILLLLLQGVLHFSCTRSGNDDAGKKQDLASLQVDSVLRVAFQKREQLSGDLDSMVARGVIRVLVPYSRTFYFLDGARQRGLIYEYMKGFESYLRKRVRRPHRPVSVVFLPVPRGDLLRLLVEGYGDVAAGVLTITGERESTVDFCSPLDNNVDEILVTWKGAVAPRTVNDLAGREVHVRRSSSYYEHLLRLNDSLRERDLAPIVLREVDERLETEDILELVNAGVFDLTFADDYIAEFWGGVFDSLSLHPEIILNAGGSIAPAVRKDNPKLKGILSEYISENPKGSLLTNVLLQRYLRENRWVKNPTSGDERSRLAKALPLFKKYGERYHLDYVFLTALAYQESRLDQHQRSSAGAVGVMQIKPSTAEAPPISIRNVEKLENNIHAGAKYLRHIITTYLSDGDLNAREQIIFAVASYNAGPSRIARLRQRAKASGFNPNKWFGQVEVLAAEEIGQEPVQYVANIVKYYLAFKLFLKRFAERAEIVPDLHEGEPE